jgi:hypothetical protein
LFNLKWGIIAGGAALALSLLTGIFSGAAFLIALLRAGVFTAVFFALGLGCSFVINNYLPELLQPESFAEDGPDSHRSRGNGSRVNITLGGGGALPDNSDEVEDISTLVPGEDNPAGEGAASYGIDQTEQDDYTNNGGAVLEELDQDNGGGFDAVLGDAKAPGPSAAPGGQVFTVTVSEGDDLGALPDLDAMAGAFLTGADEEGSAGQAAASFEPSMPARSPGGAKTQQLDGDFDPKELAAGIRTVLEKAKKG